MVYEKVKYNNQYNKEHYARLSVQIPINERESIEIHWKSKGYKSFNSYINELIQNDIKNSKNVNMGTISNNGDNGSIHIGQVVNVNINDNED